MANKRDMHLSTCWCAANPAEFFERARRDPAGAVCPFTGHIRKVYPRDEHRFERCEATKLGAGVVRTVETEDQTEDGNIQDPPVGDPIKLNEDDTQTHRILRRGIPFGEPLRHKGGKLSTPTDPAPDDKKPRGLLFLAYQSSIEDQFEFIIRNWVNNPDFKEDRGSEGPAVVDLPKEQGGGHDPIIGQNNVDTDDDGKETRRRDFTVTFFEDDDPTDVQTRRVTTKTDWVIPTGGGYFFVPSISALELLSGDSGF